MPVESRYPRDDADEDCHTYRLGAHESATVGVLEAVAAASGRPVLPGERDGTPLPPLYEAVDPEALDRIVDSLGDAQPDASISFRYADYEVTVRAAGAVEVESL
ncbi:HalOD1 output domain-containing protein [Halovivax sp.]|uniref:HalOD1 output domain-containing protein n=1 Tax=Halovivax sp. TaxID=1935978 RepID=UPI0025BB163A|nr:HalOD1 output domain-containing protein [Halovivax sp.]